MRADLLADVSTFAERAAVARAQHNTLVRGIMARPAHEPPFPEQWQVEALNTAKVAAASAQERGAHLGARVAQAVEDARRAAPGADADAELLSAVDTIAAALADLRVVESGSRSMLANSGPAGAAYAAS